MRRQHSTEVETTIDLSSETEGNFTLNFLASVGKRDQGNGPEMYGDEIGTKFTVCCYDVHDMSDFLRRSFGRRKGYGIDPTNMFYAASRVTLVTGFAIT